MINRKTLLDDCKALMGRLEADLIARSHGDQALPEAVEALQEEYAKAKEAKRTAQNFEDWRTDYATQQAAAWILSAVFVRFLEDNQLIDPPRIAGPGDRLKHARDQHEIYFRAHPTETDREYLFHVFQEVGKLPGGREVFGKYNSVFEMPQWLGPDAAGEILTFFQRIDADTGNLLHDFTDPEWDTRFLGDLYQDLSEAARKKYALLQTPEFVEEFILDRTLDPALKEFGLHAPPVKNNEDEAITDPGFRMIDPACGSGHFLLGAFRRILDRWQRKEPGANVGELVQRSLNSVHGVDINPYAIAIARFRLLIAALRACEVKKLKDSPAFHFNLVAGDSLLHGAPGVEQMLLAFDPLAHHYHAEDIGALRKTLRPGTFHAVVANPPYITVKDKILNQGYRERYATCHRKYSLAVPFMERIFNLTIQGGFTGQITANSFMKREFGKKLIEHFIPTIDLTHVIDTSGAYIPGHGTPTVILFARQCAPMASTIRTVLGIRGEPSTPHDPANGLVWSSILDQVDRPGSESDFVSAGDSPRDAFHVHPWSIGGGGAAELKEQIEGAGENELAGLQDCIGFGAIMGEDDAFGSPRGSTRVRSLPTGHARPLVEGEFVRDWGLTWETDVLFPYSEAIELCEEAEVFRWLWQLRTILSLRSDFSNRTYKECGRAYWEYHQIPVERNRMPLSIVFAFVATHNHFVLDRGGKVFKQSAPVIKLPAEATEDDHLGLLGLLNSSTACFWMKQIFHDKGSTVDSHGARQTTVAFENFREFAGTGLKKFPLPSGRPLALAQQLDQLAQSSQDRTPSTVLTHWAQAPEEDLRENLEQAEQGTALYQRQMIALQEELDWACYRLYGLVDEALTCSPMDTSLEVVLGRRAFEIVLARSMARGEVQTTWFERHGSTPITEIPKDWPEDYRRLVERRIEVIATNKSIGLIERPEYKRRWNTESWASQLEAALKRWLLDRLERFFDFDGRMNEGSTPTAKHPIALCSVAQLADLARQDPQFQEVGVLYTDDPAFDVTQLVSDLVEGESVPHLPVLRYKADGLRKREAWEETWALQRQEDATDARLDIAVPPKYKSSDFKKVPYWKLRGKLDVPKERWLSFPHCEGQDGTLMVAWAGYDHLQLAKAISAHYVDVQERFGGRDDPRLIPLLASLIELIPWLKQWHNDIDPEYNTPMGDYFDGFLQEEARSLGKTLDEIRAWEPPATTQRRGRRKKKATST
jgi:type I restriction-modification system DNA methylase subunit